MTYLIRLDLDRIRSNLTATTTRVAADEEDLQRELARRGVWRYSDQWWGASEAALARFGSGEILERKYGLGGLGGVPAPAH